MRVSHSESLSLGVNSLVVRPTHLKEAETEKLIDHQSTWNTDD